MDWLEFSVATDGEAAEAVIELFNRLGQGGAVVEIPADCFEYELSHDLSPTHVLVKAYLPKESSSAERKRRLEEGLWHLSQLYPIPEPSIRTLAEEDWANAWKQQYHRIRVGRRIVLVPAWESYRSAPDEIVIRLEPGMAFGTGLHPTTRQCLAAIEQHLPGACSVLDVGTGSGVLAIAAAKLGALSVLAIDSDPVAVAAAQDNVTDNRVDGIVVVEPGSLPGGGLDRFAHQRAQTEAVPLLESGEFDLVVANILAHVILGMAPALAQRLAPRGLLLVAGIVEGQESAVIEGLIATGLHVTGRSQERDWICLVAERR